MKYGKKLMALLVLGMLFAFLVAAEDGCGEEEQVSGPTVEEAAPESELAALDAEIAYLEASEDLTGRSADLLGRFGIWLEDTVDLYDQGVMFPPTNGAEEALIEARAITDQVRRLSVPPGYGESYAFWLAAQEALEAGIALAIAGVDELDPDLMVEGTAALEEGTRLLDLAVAAFPE